MQLSLSFRLTVRRPEGDLHPNSSEGQPRWSTAITQATSQGSFKSFTEPLTDRIASPSQRIAGMEAVHVLAALPACRVSGASALDVDLLPRAAVSERTVAPTGAVRACPAANVVDVDAGVVSTSGEEKSHHPNPKIRITMTLTVQRRLPAIG